MKLTTRGTDQSIRPMVLVIDERLDVQQKCDTCVKKIVWVSRDWVLFEMTPGEIIMQNWLNHKQVCLAMNCMNGQMKQLFFRKICMIIIFWCLTKKHFLQFKTVAE